MKSPYQVYVFNVNEFSNLAQAIAASANLPENDVGYYQGYSFATKSEQLAFVEGVYAVNSLEGPHHYAAVPLEYYLLQVYLGSDDEETYSAARAAGALFHTGVKVPVEELQNKELLKAYSEICYTTEHCINEGQTNIQMVMVNPHEPSEFLRIRDFV